MEHVTVLLVFLSLHSSCLGDKLGGLYETPEECVGKKIIDFKFTKIPITTTVQLPPITDTCLIPHVTEHISMAPMTTVLTLTDTTTVTPITVRSTLPNKPCIPTRPVVFEATTVKIDTTVSGSPIVETSMVKIVEFEPAETITETVTLTTTLAKDTKLHMVLKTITKTETIPAETTMKTLQVTTCEFLPAVIVTKRVGKTKTVKPSDVTEQHAPVTMMAPPVISVSAIDITQTRILPAVTKMVMYTTTEYLTETCGYDYKTPTTPSVPREDPPPAYGVLTALTRAAGSL
ncbi:unnamed protein product [Meganyctiphanes norvegica]|uniref:Uncharacterized protein n=1 Tax=Meganyctiphanes norvegica TaxID=48144 RepID=A0AAV2RGE9_MEGNR